MCGIVGYVGPRSIASILLVGLERLSYRGYDSSGIATLSDGELSVWKKEGKIHQLEEALRGLHITGNVGIGHTRWATHGEPDEMNAHPQICPKNRTALVHNGIIENYLELKKELTADGHIFQSQTDTEVIVHLIDTYLNGSLEEAVEKAARRLEGAFSIAVVSESAPDKVVVYRHGSPLIIGVGENENYIASDINAIMSHTKKVIYLDNNELAVIKQDSVEVFHQGKRIEKPVQKVKWTAEAIDKAGYDHYMLKEIYEQPSVLRRVLLEHIRDNQVEFSNLSLNGQDLADVSRFIIQACGTSWHSGLIAKYLFESYAGTPTEVDISSEFRYRQLLNTGKELVLGISQSGETADTLACIREAKSKFFKVLSFVNVQGSSMDRESDAVIHTHSGPEIGVASTKNYTAQILNLYLFSLFVGFKKGFIDPADYQNKLECLKKIPGELERVLEQADSIKQIAQKYYQKKGFLFVGRNLNFPTALEGALKLKEISYIHATGYPAGELKHGPIALIDEDTPVVCIAPQNSTYDKMMSNIQEIKARKGKIIAIATEGDEKMKEIADDVIWIPPCPEEHTPILSVVPLQLLAYHIAILLKCDVDQPRNLAKSVTVE